MPQPSITDYYEVLQVSPRADRDTIERVFRLLAKRLHPDNTEHGDVTRFTELLEAFRILSDPESRAQYDVRYEAAKEERWRLFGPEQAPIDTSSDQHVQTAILSILYKACRNDADNPGVGIMNLERLLGCDQDQIRFHLWYLRERGWMKRLENGMLAITVSGVDHVLDSGGPGRDGLQLMSGSTEPAQERTASG